MATVHLLIKGKVQGVFYRKSAWDVATKTGITGWIKNTPEGDVEALVSGTEEQLRAFLEWCKKGPARADVAEVVTTIQAPVIFTDFKILH